MKPVHVLLAACFAVAAGAAHAQARPASAADGHAAHHPATAGAPRSDGEVRKIDKAQGKLTLRHGPLDHLGMPPMTMVFKVAEPQLLDGLKEGDKVSFSVEKRNGVFTVTAIEPAR